MRLFTCVTRFIKYHADPVSPVARAMRPSTPSRRTRQRGAAGARGCFNARVGSIRCRMDHALCKRRARFTPSTARHSPRHRTRPAWNALLLARIARRWHRPEPDALGLGSSAGPGTPVRRNQWANTAFAALPLRARAVQGARRTRFALLARALLIRGHSAHRMRRRGPTS